jgi:protein O-mannosyl-transferase
MPVFVYASPAIIVALLVLLFIFFKRNRFVLFGVLFFLANIFTVLKFVPVGDAIIADRYSYIPYIGLFFIVGYAFNKLIYLPDFKRYKKFIQIGGIALLVILSLLTWARTMVWKNTFTFWGDAIKKGKSYWRPYYCIGQQYYDEGDYHSAVKFFSGGIENDRYCPPTVYMWRGITYMDKMQKLDSAIADFKKVLDFGNKADPSQVDGRLNLGLAYYRKGIYDDALKIYNELATMIPNDPNVYFQRALVYQYENNAQPQLALADYNKALQINPGYAIGYLNRGSLYVDKLNNYDAGIADFNKALELDPNNADAPINKGIAYYKKGDFDQALSIYNTLPANTNNTGRTYYLKAIAYAGKKDYVNALQNAALAQKAGMTLDAALLQQWKAGK